MVLEGAIKGLSDIYVHRKGGMVQSGETFFDEDLRKDVFKTVLQRLEEQRGRIIGRFDAPFEDVDEFGCDGCDQDPIVGSIFHKIGDCDICEECFQKLGKDEKDEFVLAEDAESTVEAEEFSCDGDGGMCSEDPITGRRFHKIEDFDLCNACFGKLSADEKNDCIQEDTVDSLAKLEEDMALADLLARCGKASLLDIVKALDDLLRHHFSDDCSDSIKAVVSQALSSQQFYQEGGISVVVQ